MTQKIRVGKRVVGVVIGRNFIKKVHGSKHFLKVPPAIAFDIQSLKDAFNKGAQYAVVIDQETQIEYISTLANIYANGFNLERGYGKQVALPIGEWKTITPPVTDWANAPTEAIYDALELIRKAEERGKNAS